MLENLPFTGTMRVANKGTDAALVVRPVHTPEAMKAARRCGVRGISTAVLDPPDRRTLEYFCELTGRLVFADQALLEAHPVPPGTRVLTAEERTEAGFAAAVMALMRAGENLPGI